MITTNKSSFLLKLFPIEDDLQGALAREGVSNKLMKKKRTPGCLNEMPPVGRFMKDKSVFNQVLVYKLTLEEPLPLSATT